MIYAAAGNCHVYVDASADLAAAERIIVNAKVQRPGTCNSAETLLVHSSWPRTSSRARSRRCAPTASSCAATSGCARSTRRWPPASDSDWGEEFLALVLAVRVVDSVEEAIDHVNEYGSGHSEAIVTNDRSAARAFQLGIDSACIYVNASTRFTDGGEFGMGAEIGNSTQKLHARGPIGLRELCSTRYLVEGDGQVRA